MKIVHCDWCGKLMQQKELKDSLGSVTIYRDGGPSTEDDFEEYDVHQECGVLVMTALRDFMMAHHMDTHKG